MAAWSAGTASAGDLSARPAPGLHTRPAEPEALGVGPALCALTNPPGGSDTDAGQPRL